MTAYTGRQKRLRLSVPLRIVVGAASALLVALTLGCACWHTYVCNRLAQAAREGQPEQVVYWLNRGADVNARDGFGDTPLMMAARSACPGVARALLEHGANPRLRDDFGLSAAHWATLHMLDSRAFRRVNGVEIRQVPRPEALQTIALLSHINRRR